MADQDNFHPTLREGEEILSENLDPTVNCSVAYKNANTLCSRIFKPIWAVMKRFKVG